MPTKKRTAPRAPVPTATPLPKGVLEKDLVRPKFDSKDPIVRVPRADLDGYAMPIDDIVMYHTERFGWCIATLQIAKARRGTSFSERTYAINTEGALCRIGNGPHVTRSIRVYVRESRLAALQWLLDLREKGSVSANTARDTISTRRARGALRRGMW